MIPKWFPIDGPPLSSPFGNEAARIKDKRGRFKISRRQWRLSSRQVAIHATSLLIALDKNFTIDSTHFFNLSFSELNCITETNKITTDFFWSPLKTDEIVVSAIKIVGNNPWAITQRLQLIVTAVKISLNFLWRSFAAG